MTAVLRLQRRKTGRRSWCFKVSCHNLSGSPVFRMVLNAPIKSIIITAERAMASPCALSWDIVESSPIRGVNTLPIKWVMISPKPILVGTEVYFVMCMGIQV